jgi:hypothetical protein
MTSSRSHAGKSRSCDSIPRVVGATCETREHARTVTVLTVCASICCRSCQGRGGGVVVVLLLRCGVCVRETKAELTMRW